MSGAPVNVGDILAGKYLVERVLGAGGVGVVVAARHMQLDEHVAIKFLLPEAAKSRDLVARFARESRAAVKIKSEHVARVHDVGTLESGSPYIVMEYLDGSDLGAFVKEHGPLLVEPAVDYILQACEAMAEAHVHGIIHRDLKPSNIFLTTRADGSPSIKVIDFGMSKLSERPVGEMEITGTLEARGSPLFMSPEQMVSTRDVDARSDIWSLGIALFHILTGQYPFQAPTMPQICGLVLTAEPTPLADVLPDAPFGLDERLRRCLEKDPALRYQNVGEMAMALAEFGSPAAQLSVERIARIIRAGGLPPVPLATVARRTSSPEIIAGSAGPATEPMPGAGPLPGTTPHGPVFAYGAVPSPAPTPPPMTEPMYGAPLVYGAAPGPGAASVPGAASADGAGARRRSSQPAPKARGAPAPATRRSSSPDIPPPRASASVSSPQAAELSGGAITAGPVVGPGEMAEGPSAPRTSQLVLATALAALVLMLVTAFVGLLVLGRDGAPKAAAGPSSTPVAAAGASSSSSPVGPSSASVAPSPSALASSVPASTPTEPVADTATPRSSSNPVVVATVPVNRTASTAPAQPPTSKPSAAPTGPRPKPSVDLFDTPK